MKKIIMTAGMLIFALTVLASEGTGNFEPLTNLVWRIPRYAKIEGNILTVDVPKGQSWCMCTADIDLSKYDYKGFTAEIRAEGTDISVPRERWNGLKFMFSYTNLRSGIREYPNTPSRLGSFTNQIISVITTRPGMRRGKGQLTLGLQGSSGKVVFDLSTLRIAPIESFFPYVNQDYKVKYPDNVKNMPLLRGVMLPGGPCKEDDFKTLKEWGATLARYQMGRGFMSIDVNRDNADFDKWLDGKLDHLEQVVLPLAKKYGIRIIVDLHTPPGGRESSREWRMFFNKSYAHHFVECWKRIARRFKARPEIYGFDLVNEPNQIKRATAYDYWTIQKMAAEAVREIDPVTTIIIESNDWDSADAFSYLSPLAMDNVIYQVHMYLPFEFTHQGVHVKDKDNTDYPHFKYPNPEKKWDRNYLKMRLAPVLEFQKKHNAKILVGEFSAITWAEGADKYISDCIEVFEEYGWDWTYHAFREWPGWSVEHEYIGGGKYRPSADNPRRRALLNGLKRGVE